MPPFSRHTARRRPARSPRRAFEPQHHREESDHESVSRARPHADGSTPFSDRGDPPPPDERRGPSASAACQRACLPLSSEEGRHGASIEAAAVALGGRSESSLPHELVRTSASGSRSGV